MLQKLYLDNSVPKEVRRRILEASVRAPEDWHKDAIKSAYLSGDQEWMLTAVFSMRWVRGFDEQILEALKNADPEIHYEAVNAAGDREVGAAWPHIKALVQNSTTPKPLLLAAIGAAADIRPGEAAAILGHLVDSNDEDIAEAVNDTIEMAQMMSGQTDEEEDLSGEWIN